MAYVSITKVLYTSTSVAIKHNSLSLCVSCYNGLNNNWI